MKRYIMEYVRNGRVQQCIFAENMNEAKKKAATIAKFENIKEYYVYAG